MSPLYVISGSLRGRRLTTARRIHFRPTTSYIREVVFNVIGPWIAGRTFCDLFAGSGIMGIEALSRGAHLTFFVEADKRNCEFIGKNLEVMGVKHNGLVIPSDFRSGLKRVASNLPEGRHLDILYADPPYEKGYPVRILEVLAEIRSSLTSESLIFIETSEYEIPPEIHSVFTLKSVREASASKLLVYSIAETGLDTSPIRKDYS